MKIAIIGHKTIPSREGGIEVVVDELSTRYSEKGHDVTVYNRLTRKYKKITKYKSIRVVNIPTFSHKSLEAVIYSFLATIHAIFCGYDVIHFHALGPSVMLFIAHICGIKSVVTVHGLNYKTPKWRGFGAKYIMLGEKIVAKYADEVIVLSEEQRRYFLEKYNRKTQYIPNGVTLPSLREVNIIKEKWGLEKDKYILFLSRIVPGKGLEYLIEAFKTIDSDKKLVIAGDSKYVDDFVKKVRDMAKDDKRINFIGFVDGEIIDELYSNAYLFVFPSEAEGMPMCLLEAMSYNCRCLVSDIPENIEVIGEMGYTFKSTDVENLANKLKIILGEDNKRINTREYVKEIYNWDDVVNKTISLYCKEEM